MVNGLIRPKTCRLFFGDARFACVHPHPLVLHLFSKDTSVRAETCSGGAGLNDRGWYAVNAAEPFGGVGSRHGVEGLRELSKALSMFHRAASFPTRKMPRGSSEPLFGSPRFVDFVTELRLDAGPGKAMGESIPNDRAEGHICELVVFNDWSA